MDGTLRLALAAGALGPRQLRVYEIDGHEAVSDLYSWDVFALASLPVHALEAATLGRRAYLAIRSCGKLRTIHGMISAIAVEGAVGGFPALTRYRLRLVPRAFLLRHRKGSRIFQQQRCDDVIRTVLGQAQLESHFDLDPSLPVRAYTTQYEESEWDFVSRLCAENGILFYFEQPPPVLDEMVTSAFASAEMPLPLAAEMLGEAAALPVVGEVIGAVAGAAGPLLGERIVFTNQAHYAPLRDGGIATTVSNVLGALAAELPSQVSNILGAAQGILEEVAVPVLHYRDSGALTGDDSTDERVTEATRRRDIRANKAVYREYDRDRPQAGIEAQERVGLPPADPAALGGALIDALRAPANLLEDAVEALLEPEVEIYEHHGRDLFPDWPHAEREPRRMLERARRRARLLRGKSVCARVEAGHRFVLEGHTVGALDGQYAIVGVRHRASVPYQGTDQRAAYENELVAVPRAVVYAPDVPERRSIAVCLTATVVGPAGQEIHVNERAEIKVRFHWPRAAGDPTTTCWLRTMHPWAGAGWGLQFVPRVGMEAVVTFEGGDPDRPLVLGCVYNGILPPPFPLPEERTKSGIRTRSTPNAEGYNELSFDDRHGHERVHLRAERDYEELVRHDRRATIGAEDRSVVGADQHLTVGGAQHIELRGERDVRVRAASCDTVEGDRRDVTRRDHESSVDGNMRVRVVRNEIRTVGGDSETTVRGTAIARLEGSAATVVGRPDAQRSYSLDVTGRTDLRGKGVVEISSEQELLLRVGESFVRIAACEIEIGSPKVTVRGEDARLLLAEGEAKTKVKSCFQVVSDDSIVLKSSGASLGLGSEAKLDGDRVLLNSPAQATDSIEASEPEPTTIEVVDADGRPMPHQAFRLLLDDGGEMMAFTDDEGRATVNVASGGRIVFPGHSTVERD